MVKHDAYRKTRRGAVTVELMMGFVVIGIPLLLALIELARIDLACRRIHFSAQEACIRAGMAGNERRDFRIDPVDVAVPFRTSASWESLAGMEHASLTLKRRYWIGSGTGHGDNGIW